MGCVPVVQHFYCIITRSLSHFPDLSFLFRIKFHWCLLIQKQMVIRFQTLHLIEAQNIGYFNYYTINWVNRTMCKINRSYELFVSLLLHSLTIYSFTTFLQNSMKINISVWFYSGTKIKVSLVPVILMDCDCFQMFVYNIFVF